MTFPTAAEVAREVIKQMQQACSHHYGRINHPSVWEFKCDKCGALK